jgi:hypothetical protein
MRGLVAAALILAAGCASERDLRPGQSTAADAYAVMGKPAEERKRPDGETWLYYPSQPFGRKVFLVRLGADGKVLGVEQRLSEEQIAKLVPNQSRKDDVHALFGAPFESRVYPRLDREIWSWHMKQYGVLPAGLHVQMTPDGVVREIYVLDESHDGERDRDAR